jgi:Phosphate-selective porin O and P
MYSKRLQLRSLTVVGMLCGLAPAAYAQTPVADTPVEASPPAPAEPAPEPVAPAAPPATVPLAAEVAPAPTPVVVEPAPVVEKPPIAGYDKNFFLQSEDGAFRLEVGARVQPRFTYEVLDGDTKDKANFSVNRARLRVSGNVFEKELTYKFEADFGKGTVALKDFYVDYGFISKMLHLRIGQFKKPFSRPGITSSGNLETNERPLSDRNFGSGRDQGAMLHNSYDKSPMLEWAVGLFNGVGETPWFDGKVTGSADATTGEVEGTVDRSAKTNIVPSMFHPQLVARVGYNHGEIKGYSEADLEGGPFRFAVAGSGAIDFDADGGDDSEVKGELDAVFKLEGVSLSGGFYISSAQTGNGFEDRGHGKTAYHAQLGYVILGKVQPVVRFAHYRPDGANNDQTEYLAGVSFYPYKHAFKWQTDVTALSRESAAKDPIDVAIRSQMQLTF